MWQSVSQLACKIRSFGYIVKRLSVVHNTYHKFENYVTAKLAMSHARLCALILTRRAYITDSGIFITAFDAKLTLCPELIARTRASKGLVWELGCNTDAKQYRYLSKVVGAMGTMGMKVSSLPLPFTFIDIHPITGS